jgi:hypothetical protein
MRAVYRPRAMPTEPDEFTRLDLELAACRTRPQARQKIRHATRSTR